MNCTRLLNPSLFCRPELAQERKGITSCTDMESGLAVNFDAVNKSRLQNIACRIQHQLGASLNMEIENIHQIMSAYSPVELDSETNIGRILQLQFTTTALKTDRSSKFKLEKADVYSAVQFLKAHESYHLRNDTFDLSNLTSFSVPTSSRNVLRGNEQIMQELVVTQLVGFCGVYKVYFPIFKYEVETFSTRKIDGNDRKIILDKWV